MKCDLDLIYEYVYNNIEYEPIYGSNKGALGTLLDQRGDDIDQAQLFVALLSAAGITQANFIYGNITVTGATNPSSPCTATSMALRRLVQVALLRLFKRLAAVVLLCSLVAGQADGRVLMGFLEQQILVAAAAVAGHLGVETVAHRELAGVMSKN